MSRRRYFEEQRSGNGAIYHCVEIDTDHDNRFEVLDLMYVKYNYMIYSKLLYIGGGVILSML